VRQLDFNAGGVLGFLAAYKETRGYPPYDPRLIVRLLVYGYSVGVRSSRAIEGKCVDDVAFRFLAADCAPDFRSIAPAPGRVGRPVRAVVAAGAAAWHGEAGPGRAGRHEAACERVAAKAMSYPRLVAKEDKLEAEVAELEATVAGLLADAEATEAAEDARYSVHGKDADLPAELDRREKRLARLQAARAQIEAEAADKAGKQAQDAERRRQDRAGGADQAKITEAGRAAAEKARPNPKAQANFTDHSRGS
jgi:hypothetical protein